MYYDANDIRYIIPIINSPKPPLERISFSIKALNNCIDIAIIVIGDNKSNVIESLINKNINHQDNDLITYNIKQTSSPLSLINNKGEIVFFIDNAAAISLI